MIVVDAMLLFEPKQDENCFDFVRHVRKQDTGEDICDGLQGMQGAFNKRRPSVEGMRTRRRIPKPVDGCFVVMQRKHTVPHIGVYVRGNVLHLSGSTVYNDTLDFATRRYKKVTFYA